MSPFKHDNWLAVDTSSFIILKKAGILNIAATHFQFHTTYQVITELKRATWDEHALQPLIHIHNVTPTPNISYPSSLSATDKSILELFTLLSAHGLLSDDGKLLKWAQGQKLQHYCSLSFISALLNQDALTQIEAKKVFSRIKSIGHYSSYVITKAESLLEFAVRRSRDNNQV